MSNIYNRDSVSHITLNPFAYITRSVGTSGIALLALLLLQVVMLFVTASYSSILLVFVACLASVASELLYYFTKKRFASNFVYAVIHGLIAGLLVSSEYPPLAVFLVCFVCFTLCKYAWDGFGHSWINPVALTLVVLYFFNMNFFTPFLISAEDLQTKNAALVLIQNGTVPLAKFDAAVTAFLNRTVFHFFGVVIPEGYVSLFWDSGSSIAAFRFNFLTLISSIILISLEMVDALIPAVFILIYSLLVRFLLPVFLGTEIYGDILLALLTSGTLFSSLFLLQWHGTIPLTKCGKIIFAVISAVAAFFILGFGTSSIGFVFVVLGMNFVSPLIEYFENLSLNKKLNKILTPKVNEMLEDENV